VAKKSGLTQQMYVGGFDLSNDVGTLDLGSPRTTLEVTGIDKSAIERLLAQADGAIAFTPYFNDATGQEHLALRGLARTDVEVLVALAGGAKGSVSAIMTAKQANYDWTRAADGSFTGQVTTQASGVTPEYGTILLAKATISSTGNSASENNGGSSSAGLAGMIHLTAFSGTDYTATIQDSTNDSCFCTLKAFAQITAVNKAERVTVSGTVNQYLRVNHGGTFNSVDVVIATRRGESVDKVSY